MNEPENNGPQVEPPEQATPDAATAAEGSGDRTEEVPPEGSTLERSEEETLYIKKGSIRRRPKYGVFGFLGGLLGLIVGLTLAQVGTIPIEQNYTRVDLSIVLVGLGVPTGILLGLLLALILDRRSR